MLYLIPQNGQFHTNRVVHSITKEPITKYKTPIKDPLLKGKWMNAMCTKLDGLVQGYQDIPGTNTITFMTHAEIKNIPSDQTVTVHWQE